MKSGLFFNGRRGVYVCSSFGERDWVTGTGYTETEDTMYDCTKIFVAPNVQNAIIRYYETKFPEVSREQIITLLLISGPKVNANLKENEVVIQKGFVSEK